MMIANPIRQGAEITAAFVVLTVAATAFASFPDQWTRDPANPVLPGLAGSSVMFHEDVYKMWGGMNDFDYATSPDGRIWAVHPASPVLVPGPEWYDEVEVVNASVVIVDDLYHMWYSCIAADGDSRIAHATSPDGIVWEKDSANPVMNLGPAGSLDSDQLIHPFVMYEEPLYRMWYNGVADSTQRILCAISLDGVLWARYSDAALEPGDPGDWDTFLGMMCVVPFGDSYYMFYTGGISNDFDLLEDVGIGYATSENGIDWVKRTPSEPVFVAGDAGAWDELAVGAPVVLATDNEFMMWYWGTVDFEHFSWGVATASFPPPVAVPEVADFRLSQNFPNPFNPRTTLSFTLPEAGHAVVAVYDAKGQMVARLVDESLAAGAHTVDWDGRDAYGASMPSGTYFCRLTTAWGVATRKLSLLR